MSSVSADDLESLTGECTEYKRKSRNMSEKKRRDAFNKLILELATMVACGERKLDKSNVLKQTITFLKAHNQKKSSEPVSHLPDRWKPTFLTNQEYTCLMLDSLSAGVLVLSSSGTVMFSSDSLNHLYSVASGVKQSVMKGTLFMDHLTQESATELQRFLSTEVLMRAGGAARQTATPTVRSVDVTLKGWNDNMLKVKLVGKFKRVEYSIEDIPNIAHMGVAVNPNGETLCFVCVVRPVDLSERFSLEHLVPARTLAEKLEFTATFNMEWKFTGLDQRAVYIIGYLPFELLGNSGYDYYHYDDLETITHDHKQLMSTGRCVTVAHRFLTKSQQWLWLRSVATVTYHQFHSKPEFILCTSTVVGHPEQDIPIKIEPVTSSTPQVSAIPKSLPKPKPSKVLRPQPGVSIEHSPIASPRPKVPRSLPPPSSESSNSNPNMDAIMDELKNTAATLEQQVKDKQLELVHLLEQQRALQPPPRDNNYDANFSQK